MNTPLHDERHTELAKQVDRFVSEQLRSAAPCETEDDEARRLVNARRLDLTQPAGDADNASSRASQSLKCAHAPRISSRPILPAMSVP